MNIVELAKEAGLQLNVYAESYPVIAHQLEKFYELAFAAGAAHEREKQAEQEAFDMDDHPPHRLCECRKCMEYFTPLPDCDAHGHTVSQEYQDHLVNQSFDWSAMAAKHQFMEGYRIGLAEMREACAKVCDKEMDDWDYQSVVNVALNNCAAAIRAIKFEGDTGFRPVSEMIAEHKQDPKKGADIEKAKMRKATRAEKIAMSGVYEVPVEQAEQKPVAWNDLDEDELAHKLGWRIGDPLYMTIVGIGQEAIHHFKAQNTAPVRTKDLTDDEINKALEIIDYFKTYSQIRIDAARAVIAADREKNK